MEFCKEKMIHENSVKAALGALPDEGTLERLTDIFKALSDPGRMKILIALSSRELCVCDLSAVCAMSESAVSHQLRILRNLKMVRKRRDGKVAFYRLDDHHVETVIRQSMDHVQE